MSLAQIKALIDALEMPALFIDQALRISAVNKPALSFINERVVGRTFSLALRQPSVIDAIETCANERSNQTARYLTRIAGKDVVFDLHCAYVASGLAGVLVTFRDITQSEQNDQARSDFVANVSHELRTPLTAVMGFIETLQGPALGDPKASQRFLSLMSQEAERMDRLIDDLLSLSRVEAQARQRPSEHVELNDLLGSVVQTLGNLASDTSVTLDVQRSDAPIEIQADPDQLRQVFMNLIENGIKYGGAGGSVTASVTGPAFEPRLRAMGVRVCIKDTGAGFDPVHIPRLTERFYRIDSHRNREKGGTGLGLAIVKHIISRHNGRLEIATQIGQGSEFTAVFPVA